MRSAKQAKTSAQKSKNIRNLTGFGKKRKESSVDESALKARWELQEKCEEYAKVRMKATAAGGVPGGVGHLKKEKESAAAEQAAVETESGPTFTLQELQKREGFPAPVYPDGVDVANRETYLANADFQTHFGMDKAAFAQLPGWKRTAAKKKLKLY